MNRAGGVLVVVSLVLMGIAVITLTTQSEQAGAQVTATPTPARAWALVAVTPGLEEQAFATLVKFALENQWNGQWQIKRIDRVVPMKEYPPLDARRSLVVAVKAKDREALLRAFASIDRVTREFVKHHSHVIGFEGKGRPSPPDLNWP